MKSSSDEPAVEVEGIGSAVHYESASATEIKGRSPSDDDLFYVEWGRETEKNNLKLANEILRQLVSLMSLLLGGSSIFINDTVVPHYLKVPILISFFIGFIFAFFGMMPFEGQVAIKSPANIKLHKLNALEHKRQYIWRSGTFLAFGLGLFIAGAVLNSFQ